MDTLYKARSSDDEPRRRKGRPAGKNRIPLSMEQRRARNAQYERERRCETAEAMAQLAKAAGCDSTISNGDLLAEVISQLQNAAGKNTSEEIAQLRRCNEKLMCQIATLEGRLDNWENQNPKKRKANEFHENGNSAKRLKRKPQQNSEFKSVKYEQTNDHVEYMPVKCEQVDVKCEQVEVKCELDEEVHVVVTEDPLKIEPPSSDSRDSDTGSTVDAEIRKVPDVKSDSEVDRWSIENLISKYL